MLLSVAFRAVAYTDTFSSLWKSAPDAVAVREARWTTSTLALCLTEEAKVVLLTVELLLHLCPYLCAQLTLCPTTPIVQECGALAANTIAPSTAAASPNPLLAAAPAFADVLACRRPDVTPTSSAVSVPIARFHDRGMSRTRDTNSASVSSLDPPSSTSVPSSARHVFALAIDTQPRRRMSRRRSAPPWRVLVLVFLLGAATLTTRRRGSRCGRRRRRRRPKEVTHP